MKQDEMNRMTETIANLVYKKIFGNICKRCGRLKDTEGELCGICKAKEEDNMKYQREARLEQLQVQIDNIKRDIEYKKKQIEDKDFKETRIVKIADNGESTRIDGYVDNVKPEHLLLNEIRDAEANIKANENQLKLIKKAQEEDDKSTED